MNTSGWTTPELVSAAELLADLLKAEALSPADYEDKYWKLRAETKAKAQLYVSRVVKGEWSVWQFRDAMTKTLRAAFTQAYRFGAGSVEGRTILRDGDYLQIATSLGDDLAYLDRFTGLMQNMGWSEKYLDWRAGKYADALHATFWAGRVSRFPETTIYRWIAVDDLETCDPCAELNDKLYTLGSLPGLPGEICRGGGNCRCTLDPVDPQYLSPAELQDLDTAA